MSTIRVGAGKWRKGATGRHWAVYDYIELGLVGMRTLGLTVEGGSDSPGQNIKVATGPRPYSMSLSDI